jgi:programmed cell death 8 (apoptosis-inducing factor)
LLATKDEMMMLRVLPRVSSAVRARVLLASSTKPASFSFSSSSSSSNNTRRKSSSTSSSSSQNNHWPFAAGLAAAGGATAAAAWCSASNTNDTPINDEKSFAGAVEGVPIKADLSNQEYRLARQNTTRKVKNHYQYVIMGAGTTAYAAIETIFNRQPDADILLISNEAALPQPDVFRHHALSAPLLHSYNEWRRHTTSKLESEPDAISSSPITLLLNNEKSLQLDVDKQRVLLEDNSFITYDRCLIATAGKDRGLWAVDRRKISYSLRDRINTCSTIYDFEQLDNLHNIMANKHVSVVGGGFLGTELALALAVRGRETGMTVSQIYAEKGPLCRYIPNYLGLHVQRLLHSAGVRYVNERLVTDVKDGGDDAPGALRISLMGWNKESIYTDYSVLAPTHVEPCVDVAVKSGLELDTSTGGIAVNQQLEAVGNVFVAGGVASYYDGGWVWRVVCVCLCM